MKQYSILFFAALVLASCGGGKKEGDANLNDLKAKLEKEKKAKETADASVRSLEDQLAKLDTANGNSKAKLVAFDTVRVSEFRHFIDLQGRIDADNISYITPRGMGGQVKALYIKQGDNVRKGQLILKLDDAIVRQKITAANQQMQITKTQLEYAKNIAQRQKNLWDQGIGTEVQLISANTNVATLENQLKAAQENVKISQEELKTANVYSDVSGVADVVYVKVGEIFSGAGQIKVVNTSTLKAVVNVPENYLSSVHQGQKVTINIPDAENESIATTISLVSQTVDPLQRSFIAEAKVAAHGKLKPNQIAIMHIMDYFSPNAVIIPVNIVQSDEKGKYVFVAVRSGNGKTVVVKKNVQVGQLYGDKIEIQAGLSAGEQLITEGYQNLYEGQQVTDQVK